ncbi:MAG: PQQ-dependent sugar dehydrogenase [Balneolaceae bacterium]
MRHLLLTVTLSLFCLNCLNTEPAEENTNPSTDDYRVVEAFPNLDFTRPVDLQHPGDETGRLFVVEQRGVIQWFENDPTTTEQTVFLDISGRVNDSGNEEGLLGLAFHPEFQDNGYFYVNYTNNEGTNISRFRASPDDPGSALPESEEVILSFDQPYSNHNGGQVSFGPDGYLYIAVGDGGAGGDPQGHGQNRSTLLGTILRIDVDNREGDNLYAIPPDNPFAGNSDGYREEIYAYGLRNPWRFSFDPETDNLWTGDVGQGAYEEVSIIENGGNYGWNIMEANHCFSPSSGCDRSGLELPVWEYDRSRGDVSVTGGFVYRGPTLPGLEGTYIYGDFASGRIWSLNVADQQEPVNSEIAHVSFGVSSFGVDAENELYICGFDGKIHRLEPL